MNIINKTSGITELKSLIIKGRKQMLEHRVEDRRTVTEASWVMGKQRKE